MEAKKLMAEILETGTLTFSKHAREEMKKDNLNDQDAINVLRAGVCDPAEWENGTWRYPFRTPRMCFVIAFRDEAESRVVTAWRFK